MGIMAKTRISTLTIPNETRLLGYGMDFGYSIDPTTLIALYKWNNAFIFDIEDEIMNICRTFSMDNKKQQQNLIETIKQNCRKIVREKTGKKPFTNINIARI